MLLKNILMWLFWSTDELIITLILTIINQIYLKFSIVLSLSNLMSSNICLRLVSHFKVVLGRVLMRWIANYLELAFRMVIIWLWYFWTSVRRFKAISSHIWCLSIILIHHLPHHHLILCWFLRLIVLLSASY